MGDDPEHNEDCADDGHDRREPEVDEVREHLGSGVHRGRRRMAVAQRTVD